MLLSAQQILVCFLRLPKQLCQGAVKDLECSMPRPGLCSGSNVSIYCQLWTAYIWLCIYTVNEVNLWRSPQHAAFDAVNSSLLSATSQQLSQSGNRGSGALHASALFSAVAQM